MPRKTVTAYFWTTARLTELASLRDGGMTWDVIAERMGRDPRRCQAALSTFRKTIGAQKVKAVPWTAHEDSRLWEAREVDGKPWKETSAIVGRTVNACIARLDHLRFLRKARKMGNHQVEDPRVDSEGLTRWLAHCAALQARSPAAQILGDPPPGFSALDQKRREAMTP